MVEYLLGEFDFYKVISIDSKRITRIQSYNMHGQLNRASKTIKPQIHIPVACLPTRIVNLEFKQIAQTQWSYIWMVVGNLVSVYIMRQPKSKQV